MVARIIIYQNALIDFNIQKIKGVQRRISFSNYTRFELYVTKQT